MSLENLIKRDIDLASVDDVMAALEDVDVEIL
jgi:hypothetical protein